MRIISSFSILISSLASPILLSLTRRILLCQHELFAHQTARTVSGRRLMLAAQAYEVSLFRFTLTSAHYLHACNHLNLTTLRL